MKPNQIILFHQSSYKCLKKNFKMSNNHKDIRNLEYKNCAKSVYCLILINACLAMFCRDA